jgi:hypothetical protein
MARNPSVLVWRRSTARALDGDPATIDIAHRRAESGRSVRLGPSPLQVYERPAPPRTCRASAPGGQRPAHSTLTVSGYLPVVLLDLDVPDVLPLMCGQVWVVPLAAYRDMRLCLPAPYDARDIV